MISRGLKIFCLDESYVSDKPWFIQIRNRISEYRNKNLKSSFTSARNIYKPSDDLNYSHIESNLPYGKTIKYSEISLPDVQQKSRQHIRGNPLKYDSSGINSFIQDPICVNELKTQCSGMEQPFVITGIIPDG
jgi:hypothetical protein